MKKPCTILATADLKIPGYESSGVRGLQSGSDRNGADEDFVCELDPEDAPNGHANQVVSFNLDESQKQDMLEGLYSGDLVSGSSTYYDPDAEVSSDEVKPGKGNAFGWTKNGKAGDGRRLDGFQTSGNREYLVVRVTDVTGKVRPESPDQIGDDIFGTISDPVNLKSQAFDCSFEQLNILPGYIDPAMEAAPGVVEVTISVTLEGNSRGTIRNAVTTAVQNKLGFNLPGRYSNVLYVLEKCYQDCGWAAYAYINSWNSVYQSGYYKQTGVLMHDLGHNWGLAHSGGLDGQTYTGTSFISLCHIVFIAYDLHVMVSRLVIDSNRRWCFSFIVLSVLSYRNKNETPDHTGLMGNPLYSDDVGKMCFNAAKVSFLPLLRVLHLFVLRVLILLVLNLLVLS